MIKKSTLFLLLGAIALGAAVYYFDWKRGQKEEEKSAAEASKPAFSLPAGSEIVSMVVSRPQMTGEAPVHVEKQNGTWQITQPIHSQADQHIVGSIAEAIAGAHIEANEPGTPERLKVYGLDPPAISVTFKLQNGAEHTLKIGNKDYANTYVYGLIDNAKDAALLPGSLRTQTDLSLDFFRDHDALHFSSGDIRTVSVKNPAGQWEAKKDKDDWVFAKPIAGVAADGTDITSLLNAVSGAKVTAIVSDSADNLGKYGLASPSITFTATDAGGKPATLFVGKKEGQDYYAKDSSRPTIVKINEALYKKLTQKYTDLRDKRLIHAGQNDFNRVELQNEFVKVIIAQKSENEWTAEAPPELKGKPVATWKILTPITTARAQEIVDHPSGEILAKLAKPLVQMTLTQKDGKTLVVSITAASGDFVDARTNSSPLVYKLSKNILNDLNSKQYEY
jgi:Domain of unknown function (DUF4340)